MYASQIKKQKINMKKTDIVKKILGQFYKTTPKKDKSTAFAPANIALCKYWGKRDVELNLPTTSSISISLCKKGTTTTIQKTKHQTEDKIILNNKLLKKDDDFVIRITQFLNLFKPTEKFFFTIKTNNNIPTAAGIASSASGFAALVKALNDLFDWKLDNTKLSILARLGSGSACRSLWQGFVKWDKGTRPDGMDSYAKKLPYKWKELCVGLLILSSKKKIISSSVAMQRTLKTSQFYPVFLKKSQQDMKHLEEAIIKKDFEAFGKTAESNSKAMHTAILTAKPTINYTKSETEKAIQVVLSNRQKGGCKMYFTQDAGANLKIFFLLKDKKFIKQLFPSIEIVKFYF